MAITFQPFRKIKVRFRMWAHVLVNLIKWTGSRSICNGRTINNNLFISYKLLCRRRNDCRSDQNGNYGNVSSSYRMTAINMTKKGEWLTLKALNHLVKLVAQSLNDFIHFSTVKILFLKIHQQTRHSNKHTNYANMPTKQLKVLTSHFIWKANSGHSLCIDLRYCL